MAEMGKPRPGSYFAMVVVLLTALSGLAGLALMFSPGVHVAQALGVVAAALAFGLLSNAIWRH